MSWQEYLYEIVHIEYCPISGVSVFVTYMSLSLWILSTFLCKDFGNNGRSFLVRNFGPQWKYVRVPTQAFWLIIYLLHFEVNYICVLPYFPAHKTHHYFFVRHLRNSDDECTLILVIHWKKTGLLRILLQESKPFTSSDAKSRDLEAKFTISR
jgi:hypothetical protein